MGIKCRVRYKYHTLAMSHPIFYNFGLQLLETMESQGQPQTFLEQTFIFVKLYPDSCRHTCLFLRRGSKSTVPYPAKTQERQSTYTYPIRGERIALSPKSSYAVVHKSVILMSISSSKWPMFSHAVVSSLSPQVIIIFVFVSVSISFGLASSLFPSLYCRGPLALPLFITLSPKTLIQPLSNE